MHKHWLHLHTTPKLLAQVRSELEGEDLVCFCAPKCCHGDVYLRIANLPSLVASFNGRFEFLSNFYHSPIRSKRCIIFPTAEHAYQAFKTRDLNTRRHIAGIEHPGAVKKFARTIPLRADWDKRRVTYMSRVVTAKFLQNPRLTRMLIDTCDVDLVEGNSWGDRFWGVCGGVGENNLGSLLVRVRASVRQLYLQL